MTMKPDRTIRAFFEVLSALFVIGALFAAIYSDSHIARAVAGVILISIVSAFTASVMRHMERDHE